MGGYFDLIARLRSVQRGQSEQARRAAEDLSCLADRLAESEDSLAATFERLAEGAQPSRAEALRAKAAHSRAFALHERRERDRWAAVARN